MLGCFALSDDGCDYCHAHAHAHPESGPEDDGDSPSTGGLPISLAIALFAAGLLLGVVPFSCT